MIRRMLLICCLVVPGLALVVFFGYCSIQDWAQLSPAWQKFRAVAAVEGDLRPLFRVWADQDIHRLNLIADSVCALLAALLVGIGLHGLCTMPQNRLMADQNVGER